MSNNRIDKWMWFICTMEFNLGNENGQITKYNMDKSCKHNIDQKKPDNRRKMQCALIYRKLKNGQS